MLTNGLALATYFTCSIKDVLASPRPHTLYLQRTGRHAQAGRHAAGRGKAGVVMHAMESGSDVEYGVLEGRRGG
jgi:hypothetical protein